MLIDQHGREMRSLRISVTDRCNLRCRYCTPASGCPVLPQAELSTDDEIVRLTRLLVGQGIRRVKLTGGEPLLRPGLPALVRRLAAIEGVEELSLTTNGTLLAAQAEALAVAGLRRVTVSLDTLDPLLFRQITRGGALEDVLDGLHAAQQAGLEPIKINVVALREWNLDEAVALASFAVARGWELRFIEYMPLVAGLGLPASVGVPTHELRARLEKALGPLVPASKGALEGPAESWSLPGARGRVGFISAMSGRFCASCDRLRMGADGYLRLCMGQEDGLALGQLARQGSDDASLIEALRQAVYHKPAGHSMDTAPATAQTMSRIGG